MKRALTEHEFKINTGAWTACDETNTLDNGNGLYTIDLGLYADIAINQLKVRVKAMDGNPASAVLTNSSAFISLQLDADASTYLTAIGILPGTLLGDPATEFLLKYERIIKAVHELFTELKAASLYTKIKYLWLFLGEGDTANFTNAKNPGSNTLVPVGASQWLINRLGVGNIDTYEPGPSLATGVMLSEFNRLSLSAGMIASTSGGGYYFGCDNAAYPGNLWGLLYGRGANFISSNTVEGSDGAGSTGLFTINTIDHNNNTIFVNGVKILQDTYDYNPALTHAQMREVYLGNINIDDAYHTANASTKFNGLFFIGDGLTDSENVALYPIIKKWTLRIDRAKNLSTYYRDNWQFYGDSITQGFAADPIFNGWASGLCFKKMVRMFNRGEIATTIVDCNNTQISSLIPKNASHTKVFIAFSTNEIKNDITSGGTTMNIPMFLENYNEVIDKVLLAGFLVTDIIIIPTYLFNTEWYEMYPGISDLQDEYAAAVETMCNERGITHCYNMKPVLLEKGGDALTTNIHPTTAGHHVITDYLNHILGDL